MHLDLAIEQRLFKILGSRLKDNIKMSVIERLRMWT
jgi:hypothetical protein